MIGMILLNVAAGFLLVFIGYLSCVFVQGYKETSKELKHVVLTEDNYIDFLNNLRNKKHMIVWVYYSWDDKDTDRSIDIAQTRYTNYDWNLNARGIGYISVAWDQMEDKEFTWEFFKRFVHSYIEMEKIEDDSTESK